MIKIENITKSFGDKLAVNNISFEISDGVIYGLVGSNGAGKSTLLRLITGIYKGDSGKILVDGEEIYDNQKAKEKLIIVADDLYFLNQSNIRKMIELYKSIYKNFDEEYCYTLAANLDLDTKKAISTFSKGQKRQVATILALSTKVKYMFFDETFDGLDPVIRNVMKKLIYDQMEKTNSVAILTSHSLRELEDTCDKLALLHEGGIIFQSDISELKTTFFKVQVAVKNEFSKEELDNLAPINIKHQGSVYNFIFKGATEVIMKKLQEHSPLFTEILPLSLEEVFIYEMQNQGYNHDWEI